MQPSLKSSSGRSSVTLPLLLASTLFLSSCSGLNPMSFLTGGGPNVAANTQIGKENSQAVVSQTSRTEVKAGDNSDIKTVSSKVSTESIQEVTVNEVPPWIILLLIVGWLLPSPNEIARWITNMLKRNKKNA